MEPLLLAAVGVWRIANIVGGFGNSTVHLYNGRPIFVCWMGLLVCQLLLMSKGFLGNTPSISENIQVWAFRRRLNNWLSDETCQPSPPFRSHTWVHELASVRRWRSLFVQGSNLQHSRRELKMLGAQVGASGDCLLTVLRCAFRDHGNKEA